MSRRYMDQANYEIAESARFDLLADPEDADADDRARDAALDELLAIADAETDAAVHIGQAMGRILYAAHGGAA